MAEVEASLTSREATRRLPRSTKPEDYPAVDRRKDRIMSFESPRGTFTARWERHGWENLDRGIHMRAFSIVIDDEQGAIGYVQGREWRISERVDFDDVLDCMDCECADAHSMCVALQATWWHFPSHVSGRGTIVSLDRAYMETRSSIPGAWITVAKRFMEDHTRHAILMVQAHPFMEESLRGSPAWKARQKAMIRYYARCFDARSCKGRSGDIGWLVGINPALAKTMMPMKVKRKPRPAGKKEMNHAAR